MSKCVHCGCDSDPVHGKPRSVAQLKRFFAVLRAMFAHWPESTEFKPDNEEHLRKWALIKAGHRETSDVEIPGTTDQPGLTRLLAIAIEGAVKAAGAYAFVRPDPNGGRVRIFRAKSIAFNNLDQAAFNRLNDEVEAAYAAETGLDPEQVLSEQERAA